MGQRKKVIQTKGGYQTKPYRGNCHNSVEKFGDKWIIAQTIPPGEGAGVSILVNHWLKVESGGM